MPTMLSQAAFASRKSVSRKTITIWKKAGRLAMVGKQVELEATEKLLAEGSKADSTRRDRAQPDFVTQPVKGNKSRRQGNSCEVTNPAAAEAPKAPLDEVAIDVAEILASLRNSGSLLSMADAENLKENALARLRQLEYDQKSRAVVAVADVAQVVGQQFARVRTQLLAIPAEQAPRLLRCKSAAELQAALGDLIHDVLRELSEAS